MSLTWVWTCDRVGCGARFESTRGTYSLALGEATAAGWFREEGRAHYCPVHAPVPVGELDVREAAQ